MHHLLHLLNLIFNILSWYSYSTYYGERVIVPILNKRVGLALIVYKIVSVLTSIADKIMPIAWFGIDSLQFSVHGNIDS